VSRPKLSIGIVSYNSGYRLQQCLDAIEKHAPSCAYEVVVVDNASHDGSVDALRAAPRPHVRLVEAGANLLFTGALNRAFAETTGEHFLMLNADLVALDGALDAMVRHLDEDASIGAVSAYTLDVHGAFERYVRRAPTPFEVFFASYAPARAKRWRLLRRFDHGLWDADFSKPVDIEDTLGGCTIVRRDLFDGPLMPREFGIFWSDAELARRILRKGRRIVVFPDARFTHDHEHKPRGTTSERGLLLVLDYLVGCVRYFRLSEGRGAAWRAKALLAAGASASLVAKHLPLALVGREPWGVWRARARVLRDLVRERNTLLEEAQRS